MAYGYYHWMSGDDTCTETEGKHEFPQLCRELLVKVGADKPFHALYVSHHSNSPTKFNVVMCSQINICIHKLRRLLL